jgi:hypothetical protein
VITVDLTLANSNCAGCQIIVVCRGYAPGHSGVSGDLHRVSDALPHLKPYLYLVVRSLDVLMLKDLSYLRFLTCKSGHIVVIP